MDHVKKKKKKPHWRLHQINKHLQGIQGRERVEKKKEKTIGCYFWNLVTGLYNAARRHAGITSPELNGLAQQ